MKGWQHQRSHRRLSSVLSPLDPSEPFVWITGAFPVLKSWRKKKKKKKKQSATGEMCQDALCLCSWISVCVGGGRPPPRQQSWRCALTHCLLFRGLGDKKVLTAAIVRRDFFACNYTQCCDSSVLWGKDEKNISAPAQMPYLFISK